MKKIIVISTFICIMMLSISAVHWADDYILKAEENGWLTYEIDPDKELNRADFAVLIWYSLERPVYDFECPFEDLTDPETIDAATALFYIGILKGYSNTRFAPDDIVTREMGFTALTNAFSLYPDDENTYIKYDDSEEISYWATYGVSAMTEKGYVQGTGNNMCEPKKTMTYGEIIKLLTLLYENDFQPWKIQTLKEMITDIELPATGNKKPAALKISEPAKFTASLSWGEDGGTYGTEDSQYHTLFVTLSPTKGYTFKDTVITEQELYSIFRNGSPLINIISLPDQNELTFQLTYYIFKHYDNDRYMMNQTLVRLNLTNDYKDVNKLQCIWDGEALVRVNWYDSNLKGSIDLSGFKSLKEILIYSNDITYLNVSGCTRLEFLDFTDNRIDEIRFDGCNNIEIFYANWNNLSKLDVSNMLSLKDIRCNRNNLTELNVTGCYSLEVLQCGENKVTELNLKGMRNLISIYTRYTNIKELDMSDCVNLKEFDCDETTKIIHN